MSEISERLAEIEKALSVLVDSCRTQTHYGPSDDTDCRPTSRAWREFVEVWTK
jgi:hypothetical protein